MFVWHHGQSLDAVDTWRKGIVWKDVRHKCVLYLNLEVCFCKQRLVLCAGNWYDSWCLIWKWAVWQGHYCTVLSICRLWKQQSVGKLAYTWNSPLAGFPNARVNPNAAGSSSKRVLWKPASLSIFQFQQSLGPWGPFIFVPKRDGRMDKDFQPRQVCSFWSFTSATACSLMDMWTCWHFQIFVAPKFWADFLGKMEAPSSISIFLLVMLLPGWCLYKLDAGQLRNGRKFPSAMLVETWKSCLCWRNLCQINFKVRLKLLKSKLKHYIYIYPIASPQVHAHIHKHIIYT